ncbi:MAG: DUF6079 family protein [Methanobrevibacter sp.]|jgi:hypothetical protein|nr:DUF6079 family protein [Candidatus Methanoflexus mossambicus]
MKIKDLFTFEEIQPVIKIGSIENEEKMVKNFVISSNLKDDLIYFLEYLNGNKTDKNTSINIIGNYGTGKSHLLAFISLLLSKIELREYIQDEEIKNRFKELDREFLVVKYELPATQDNSLADIFYYHVQEQLSQNYGIEIDDYGSEGDKDSKKILKDPKQILEEIILKIKEKYPEKGLIVIFDEYSDFIRQKSTINDQQYDLNFTRQLAESSSNQDFILMLSMQEHIFSSPEYKGHADLIRKIEQRFLNINITSENIEEIVSKRIVKKNENKIQEIRTLFEDLKPKFQNLSVEEDKYIDLFPLHPYVIEVFSKISFFENRSILQFISDEIRKILDKDFPEFITYDLIYSSMIENQYGISNREDVKPVVAVVNSLKDIVNSLDDRYKKNANRLIESLAIKNLISSPDKDGDKKGGDSPEKFAENLFIIPKSSMISPVDDIDTTLNMLIQKSLGQFINKDAKNNIYYINLNATIDYEQIINNKASKLGDWQSLNEKFVEEFLLDELEFELDKNINFWDPSKKYILNDTVKWKERNSFREGNFIVDIGNKIEIKDKDFTIVLHGYAQTNGYDSNCILINPKYNDNFSKALKRLVATIELIKTHTYTDVMKNKKRTIIDNELKPAFNEVFSKSTIKYKQKDYSLEDLGINSEITTEIFSQIKEKLLSEELTNKYDKYPRFKAKISYNNIENTIDSVLKVIPTEGAVKDLTTQYTNILIPLELYKDNLLDVTSSEYAKIILNKLNDDKNLDVNEIIAEFKKEPYGLQKEIVYLIIAILLRNGDIILSNRNGKSYSSTEFNQIDSIKKLEDIKYIKKESDIPVSKIQELFNVLDLDSSLISLKKNRQKGFTSYLSKIEEILNDINIINSDFKSITYYKPMRDVFNEIDIKLNQINKVNFEKLKINSLIGFKNLDYSKEHLEEINENYEVITNLKSLFKDIQEYIINSINYMNDALKLLNKYDCFFKNTKELNQISDDFMAITSNLRKLLKEDERNPLKGKIELFKKKYKEIYYNAHRNAVGEGVNWKLLEEIGQSSEYNKLKAMKGINSLNSTIFNKIFIEINDLNELRKDDLVMEELNDSPTATSSSFPDKKFIAIESQIEALYDETINTYNQWTKQILEDVSDKKDKLELLEENEQKIIGDIINAKELQDINENTIAAINNILKDIEIKEINMDELFREVTRNKDTLKLDEFKSKINEYITEKTKGSDEDKIRILVVNGDSDE